MLDDMDINCGDILVTIEAKGQETFDTILRVASGEKTKSEFSDAEDNRGEQLCAAIRPCR